VLTDHQVFANAAINLAAEIEGYLRANDALCDSVFTNATGVRAALESFNAALQRVYP
jgi:hypothetical protein